MAFHSGVVVVGYDGLALQLLQVVQSFFKFGVDSYVIFSLRGLK